MGLLKAIKVNAHVAPEAQWNKHQRALRELIPPVSGQCLEKSPAPSSED